MNSSGESGVAAKQTSRCFVLRLYFLSICALGCAALAWSAYLIAESSSSYHWLILAMVTVLAGSYGIKIPYLNSKVTIGEACNFTNILLFGPAAGVITAALAELTGSLRADAGLRRLRYAVFHLSAIALSTILSGNLFFLLLGKGPLYGNNDLSLRQLVLPLGVLAFSYYILNSSSISIMVALEARKSVYRVWNENFLWKSITYMAGAAAAGVIALSIRVVTPTVLAVVVPVLLAICFTYKTYLEKVWELNKLYLSTVESLAMAIDAKDQLTHGHVRRVQVFARGLAKSMGIKDEESLRWLEAAALLHDIGKLAIPEYLLNKPGKLTPSEFKKIKIHPAVGADILSSIRFPYDVAKDVRHHHENWDGTGYPDGLKADTIPLGARILAVVDCFDALTCDRPYRTAMDQASAMRLIRERAGSFYDPEVVAKFEGILGNLMREVQKLDNTSHSLASAVSFTEAVSGLQEVRTNLSRDEHVFRNIVATHREVCALYELAQTLGTTLDLRETLPIIASKIAKIVPFTTCVIYLHSPATGRLSAQHVSGANIDAFNNHSMELGENLSGWVALNNHAAINADPVFDTMMIRGRLVVELHNSLVYPLFAEDKCLGAISLYAKEGFKFEDDHIRIMELVAKQAATAIHNALRYEETQEDAITDHLTALPNARYLDVYFEQEVEKARRYGYPLTILGMDLDKFKQINDSYGHHVGDMMLVEVAKVLKRSARSSDVVIRYAGDEFIALMSRTSRTEAELVAKRIQQDIDNIRLEFRPGLYAQVGISIGLASYPEDGDSLQSLVQQADAAMYRNKQSRTRANVYSIRDALASSLQTG